MPMDLSTSSESRKKYRVGAVIGLAAVILVAAGIFWFYDYFKNFSPEEKTLSWTKNLNGVVRLTLSDKKSGNSSSLFGLYIVDLGAAKREAIFNLKDGRLNMTEHVSPDGLLSVYASFPSALDKKNGEKNPQLFTRNLINGERKQITKSETLLKRNPEWSPDGRQIVFMAQAVHGASTVEGAGSDLKKWSVFVTDLDGKERLISDGGYPQWLPDNQRLIVSREDGLYLCRLAADNKCERVLDLSSYAKAFLSTKIDLSRDGRMLVYANPNTGEMILIKISSLDPFQLEISRIIKARVFWPIFSEDSQYLIAEEVDYKPSNEMKPRLVVYRLDTLEKATLLNLDDFWQDKMFITDWRY